MSRIQQLQGSYESAYADAVSRVQRDYARQFLTQFRIMLRPFNLSRHDVTISSGMGSACLCINGDTFDTWQGRFIPHNDRFPVYDVLRTIEASLSYEWADWIEGESLTRYGSISEVKRQRK